jgi:ankyrin repeat protein
MISKDILQKIASVSDERTALAILASNKEMNKDIYYLAVFGKRYPDLIKYRQENEPFKKLYLRTLEIIRILKTYYDYSYISRNPELQLKLFIQNGKDVNNLLLNASQNGSLELVKYSLEKGANIHIEFALSYASQNGHLEVVKYLVEQGANIHAKDDLALREASLNGHLEIVKYLVEKEANIHAENDAA